MYLSVSPACPGWPSFGLASLAGQAWLGWPGWAGLAGLAGLAWLALAWLAPGRASPLPPPREIKKQKGDFMISTFCFFPGGVLARPGASQAKASQGPDKAARCRVRYAG